MFQILLGRYNTATVFANSVDPFIPELWANESLAILEENMVGAQLVHRDFENELAKFGDLVHTRRPGEFTAYRKATTDSVTVQDATSTDVQVPLDQQVHVSFLIRDGEESLSFKDLVTTYMAPAMLAQARFIDRVVLGQWPQFLANIYGGLGQMTSSNGRAYILGTRNKMNQNKAYMDGRNLVLTPNSETTLLNLDLFTQAQQVGDDGTALRNASLGRKLAFDMFMCQNQSSITALSDVLATAGLVNHSGGYAAGTTVLTVNTYATAVVTGEWITIAGDYLPHKITAHTETLGNTTQITISPALANAVAHAAPIATYTPGQINQSVSPTGYAAGYTGLIVYDTFTLDPQVGQGVSFTDASGSLYSIISVDTSGKTIMLDRPLKEAVADNAKIFLMPLGEYNFAFHRNALALVVRPLAMPRSGTGALSAVVNMNGLSMRATITYDGNKQGHLVTLDMLCGVALLDLNLGAVLAA